MSEPEKTSDITNTNQVEPTRKPRLLAPTRSRIIWSFIFAILTIPVAAGLIMGIVNIFPQLLMALFAVVFVAVAVPLKIFNNALVSIVFLFIVWWFCVYALINWIKKLFTTGRKGIFIFIAIVLVFGAAYIAGSLLPSTCGPTSSGCDEIRSLPKILKDKKIVFDKNANIEFDPISDSKDGTLGILDVDYTDPKIWPKTIVDPTSQKRGYLADREYIIVKAVYRHKCAICIDSSDYGYIVVQDSKGNRFISFLDENLIISATSTSSTPWDEQIPSYLKDIKNIKKEAQLEDIK